MENSTKGTICLSGKDAQGLYRLPPLSLHTYIGWLQNVHFRNFEKFSKIFNFVLCKIFLEFREILGKFRETQN